MEDNTVAIIWIIIELFTTLLLIGGLCFIGYLEYKQTHDIIDTTKEHNGTCERDGVFMKCSYQGDTKTIINSNSQCFINDIEVNCSEVS